MVVAKVAGIRVRFQIRANLDDFKLKSLIFNWILINSGLKLLLYGTRISTNYCSPGNIGHLIFLIFWSPGNIGDRVFLIAWYPGNTGGGRAAPGVRLQEAWIDFGIYSWNFVTCPIPGNNTFL